MESKKYKVYNSLELPKLSEEILAFWKEKGIFQQSIDSREGKPTFTFYEGPPSANGLPGIHHVLGRTIKDIFCRYKTLKGFQVHRRSGWDTHGLPIELQVEKRLNLNKEDIGKSISVEDYNKECRNDVMKFKSSWEEMTEKTGFWLDLDNPYVTYEPDYIETLWYLLKQLYDKGLVYRGTSIQPYSPAAGTGLSSHELNQPGCYKNVKDTSVVAQFKLKDADNTFLLAWTTTPWTLPSNAGLAVGKKMDYLKVATFNAYTHEPIIVYLAESACYRYFDKKHENVPLEDYKPEGKVMPFKVLETIKGSEMEDWAYEQLMPYVQPKGGKPFRVVTADFVTADEGTGIVHIAPTFGDDDYKVGQQKDIPAITVSDKDNPDFQVPLVDKQGRFVAEVKDFAGRYVKDFGKESDYVDVNIDICVMLKKQNRAFKVEKYFHNYPHCWRTDKPILYYPLASWFIKTTAYKDRLVALNNKVRWNPETTGRGRFGNWLENLVDWNISRARYWGTPLPIWATEDFREIKCIGSFEDLKKEVDKAIKRGSDQKPITSDFDPHRPFVDDIRLLSPSGKEMKRIPEVLDVWFDSGAMPYAQHHFPFQNKSAFENSYPADFIAEGVDQTRGWFFTLHTLAVMLFDSVAFKNVIANGLVLDKNGQKMSKRLGNAVDPIKTLDKYGADAVRWFMLHHAAPWDNLKFDLKGVEETNKKFFGTLFNVYSFFSLYANIDGFDHSDDAIPHEERPEIDRWILSQLNSLIRDVDEDLSQYQPTRAVRSIQTFVVDYLSNWYVRLCRRRFWKGDLSDDKRSAYQTLYTCLKQVAVLISPFAPFYSERLFLDLNEVTQEDQQASVHLLDFPECKHEIIDLELEEKMQMAQRLTSLVLSIRKKEKIKVRQPLQKMMMPILNQEMKKQLQGIEDLVLSEVNVKELVLIQDTEGVVVKKVKPNFKVLGPRFGKKIKLIQKAIQDLSSQAIADLERNEEIVLAVEGEEVKIYLDEVEILSEDIPGWKVAVDGKLTVALDLQLTQALQQEGLARELVNRIQNLRKEEGLEVTDKIRLTFHGNSSLHQAVQTFEDYIKSETLATHIDLQTEKPDAALEIDGMKVAIHLTKTD